MLILCEKCGKDIIKGVGYRRSIGGGAYLDFCSNECLNDPEMAARSIRMNEQYRATTMAIEAFFRNNKIRVSVDLA